MERKIEKKKIENFELIGDGGDMVATLDFPWLSFLKKNYFKKLFLKQFFFFNSNIQKFYHWSNNTNKNMMMIWVFFKKSCCLKSEYTMIFFVNNF